MAARMIRGDAKKLTFVNAPNHAAGRTEAIDETSPGASHGPEPCKEASRTQERC